MGGDGWSVEIHVWSDGEVRVEVTTTTASLIVTANDDEVFSSS